MASKRSLLLVESNPFDEALILHFLKKCNIENIVEVIRDGAKALDYLLGTGNYINRPETMLPALIIMDLALSNMDGFDILNQVRANESTSLIPIVVVVSADDQSNVNKSMQLGANSYVHKPIDFKEFRKVILKLGFQ